MGKANKEITMFQYLSKYIYSNKNLKYLVENYTLTKMPVDVFLKHFELPNDKEKVVGFILNPDNGFEISKFGFQYDSKIVDEYCAFDSTGEPKILKIKRGL